MFSPQLFFNYFNLQVEVKLALLVVSDHHLAKIEIQIQREKLKGKKSRVSKEDKVINPNKLDDRFRRRIVAKLRTNQKVLITTYPFRKFYKTVKKRSSNIVNSS